MRRISASSLASLSEPADSPFVGAIGSACIVKTAGSPLFKRMASGTPSHILSFDVEEHFRIEAATNRTIEPSRRRYYGERLEPSTRWLLDQLGEFGHKATFYIVGHSATATMQAARKSHTQ